MPLIATNSLLLVAVVTLPEQAVLLPAILVRFDVYGLLEFRIAFGIYLLLQVHHSTHHYGRPSKVEHGAQIEGIYFRRVAILATVYHAIDDLFPRIPLRLKDHLLLVGKADEELQLRAPTQVAHPGDRFAAQCF